MDQSQPTGALVPVPPSTTQLSVSINSHALAELREQRQQLHEFIKSCLVQGSDYGIIPGTPKPSLYKAGSEKLANIFRLGTRIVGKERELDLKASWALFTYRIEVFHIPTGLAIAQCEGSANSHEKKYKSRPAADMLNTLQKMAQKRAYVGAIIIATGASDFFTQDVEDMDLGGKKSTPAPAPIPQAKLDELSGVLQFGNWSNADLNSFLKAKLNCNALKDISLINLNKLIDYVKKYPKSAPQPAVPAVEDREPEFDIQDAGEGIVEDDIAL